jgi:hypothetical protein
VQVAMLAQMPYTALRDAIFTHPTMAEGLVALFSGVLQNHVSNGIDKSGIHQQGSAQEVSQESKL